MKLKLTPVYVVSFLALTFFIHEIHDWAHTLVARLVSGSWPVRAFDYWVFQPDIKVSNGWQILAILAGPVVSYTLMWMGYNKMDDENTPEDKSVGVALVLAALPLNNLLAAAVGGGDLTYALRLLFRKTDHHYVSLVGLVIVTIFCLPPLIRAFMVLPWRGQIIFFPIFLIATGYIDHWVVSVLLNKWLLMNTVGMASYLRVLGWGLFTFALWFFTRRSIAGLIPDDELPI